MKKKPIPPFMKEMAEPLRTLTRRDLIDIQYSLEDADAHVRAIFLLADRDALQELGGKSIVSILDEALIKIGETVDCINGTHVRLGDLPEGKWPLLDEKKKAGVLPLK